MTARVAIVTGASSGIGLGITRAETGHVRLVYGVQSLPVGAPLVVDTIFEIAP